MTLLKKLLRSYLDVSIYLKSPQCPDYVSEKSDKAGETGAHFLVKRLAHTETTPRMQAVLVEGMGHRAFGFTTEKIDIE